MITWAQLQQASERLCKEIKPTPCIYSHWLSKKLNCSVYLKLENLHPTGSFKERGALNKLLSLSQKERQKGVVAASAGNHAQALAYHAHRLGIQTHIFMPITTPPIKINGTNRFFANIYLQGQDYDEACLIAQQFCKKHNAIYVHAYEDQEIIAGQGTIAFELIQQTPSLDSIFVPVGGGGLIAGIAIAMQNLSPKTQLVGVQTSKLPCMWQAIQNQQVSTLPAAKTIADGIRVRTPGNTAFFICNQLVSDWHLVDDDQIAQAIFHLFEQEKVIAEGAGATVIAALLNHPPLNPNQSICAIISGGNLDPTFAQLLFEKELAHQFRLAEIQTILADEPGELEKLLHWISLLRANILDIKHERLFGKNTWGEVTIRLQLELKGKNQLDELVKLLQSKGYTLAISEHNESKQSKTNLLT